MKNFTKNLIVLGVVILAQCNIAQAQCLSANAIYVTPNGTGSGTVTSPASFAGALVIYTGDTTRSILMAGGTYNFYNTIYVPAGAHIEGGYNVNGSAWVKSPTAQTNINVYANYQIARVIDDFSDTFTVANVIGMEIDSVSNIFLKDFNLFVTANNSDIYAYESALESTRDGYSVYAIYARYASNVQMLNLTLSPDNAGNGGEGVRGSDGIWAYQNMGGGQEVDTPNTRNVYQPVFKAIPGVSPQTVGGAGGYGSPVQGYVPCQGPGCLTSGCQFQTPPPVGQSGESSYSGGGGGGGACGQTCVYSCYFKAYENLTNDSIAFANMVSGVFPNIPPAPQYGTPGSPGANGTDGASATMPGIAQEGYTFYIPGTGQKGGDGYGGGGGGGGGAGGITTIDPAASAVTSTSDLTAAAVAKVSLLAIVDVSNALGNSVCGMFVVNMPTAGGVGGGGGGGAEGGGGGGGGGSVYGIYAYECHNIAPGNITYNLGSPGTGGQGGYGGTGGPGNIGYPGAQPSSNGLGSSDAGATGGAGGNGGNGGNGQPGADGKQYQTWGLGVYRNGMVLGIDTAHTCTNSVIGVITSAGAQLSVFPSGGGYGLHPIYSSSTYSEYSVSSPMTITIEESDPSYGTYQQYNIPITHQRSLPDFFLPSHICFYDSLHLVPNDTTQQGYLWQVSLNGNVVIQSRSKTLVYVPSDTSSSATYTVSLQEFSSCCGWSVPVTHSFYIEQPLSLSISAGYDIPPYCAGAGYKTSLTLAGAPGITTGVYPHYVTTYPGVTWSTGDTSVNLIYVNNNGAYSATYMSPGGCITHSPIYAIYNIFPQPTGLPTSPGLVACTQTNVQLYADYPGYGIFNYYIDSTTPFTLPGGYQTPSVSWETNFAPGSNQQDSNFVWAAVVNEYGCAGAQRGKAVIHRIPYGPYVVPPFTDYYYENSIPGYCGAPVNYQVPTGSDYCGDYVDVTRVSGLYSGAIFPPGWSTVVYRLKTFYGDSILVPINIYIQDVNPPVIYNLFDSLNYLAAPGTCTAHVNPLIVSPRATDNCQSIILPHTYWSGLNIGDSIFGVGTTQFTFVFTDSFNLTTTGYTTLTVRDNQPPVIHCPADMIYYVGPGDTSAFVSYNLPTATDNCDTTGGGLWVRLTSGFPQFGYHPIGVTTQNFSCTDRSGNTGYCNFAIWIKDTIAPVLTCPGPLGFLADTGLPYTHISYPSPTAIDNLGAPVTISLLSGKASGDTASIGTYTAIWKGTDIYGNVGTCPVHISIQSNQAPDLICPHSITTLNDPGLCTAKIDYTVAKALDVDGHSYNPVLFSGLDSGAAFPFGTTTVIYTATDIENNKAWCTFTVTVKDTIPPVFTSPCPHDTTLNLNPVICGATLAPPVLTGTSYDCIAPRIGIWSGVSNHFFTLGTTTQEYRIIDDFQNYSKCIYNVTVVDNNTLTVRCPSDITVNNDPGKCTAYIPNVGIPVVTPFYSSSCMTTTLTAPLAPNFPTFLIGTTQVHYSVIANGHTAACNWNVTVVNTEKPHIVSPPNIVQAVHPGSCGNVINFTAPVGTDTCANGLGTYLVTGLTPGSVFPIGSTVETYVVSDLVGNTDTARFTVTVLDTVKPSITGPGNIVDSTSTMCGMKVSFNRPVGTDNSGCFVTYLVAGLDSGAQFALGTTHEVWAVRDSAGNTDTFTFNVTIKPIYPLNAGCIDNWPLSDPNGNGQVIYYPVPGTTDQYTGQYYACPGVSIHRISGIGSGGFFTPGPHNEVYQFIATGTGDTINCTTVVIDAPVYSSPNINCGTQQVYHYPVDTATCTAVASIPQVTASEGSIPVTLTYTIDGVPSTASIDTLTVGFHTVLYTANDYFGGQATCSIYIQIGTNITVAPGFLNSGLATYCQGESVTLNPNLGGNLTGATYKWITLDSVGSYYVYSTDSALHFSSIQPSNANQYHFVATDQCGAVATIGEFGLVVKSAPVTTLAGLDTVYCIYDSTNYTVSFSPAGGVLAGPGLTGNKFNPRKAGLGNHNITYSYSDTVSGCTGVSTLSVTVNSPVTVGLFADSLYCINSVPIHLPATHSTYTGAGISGTVFTPSAAGGGYHTITRTVSVGGCTSALSQNIRVNTVIPNATITAPSAICKQSGYYALSAATAGGAWRASYLVFDSATGAAEISTWSALPGIDTVIYAITKSACSSRDTAFVTIKDNSYYLPYTFPQFCITGPPVAFDTTGGKQYLGLGFHNGIFHPDSIGLHGPEFYAVVTMNNFGCQDTLIRILNLLGGQLDIYPDQFVCNAHDSLFINLGNQYDSIHWSTGSTSNQLWFTDTGSYRVFLRDTGGCYGYDTLRISVSPAPSQIVPATSVYACPADSAYVVADSSFVHYAWSNGETTQAIKVLPGNYTVTVTAASGCRYQSPQVAVTSSPDTIPPTITCPHDTVLFTNPGSCSITGLNLGTPIALDNCGIASVTNNAPATYTAGITTVTWTAKDNSNNTKTCLQRVTVTDTLAPYFTTLPPVGFVIDTSQNNCSARIPDFLSLFAANDSCASVTITQSPSGGTFATSGITLVRITASVLSGNTTVYYMIFKTSDTVAPVINCPADIATTTSGGDTTAVVTYTAPTRASNCTNSTVQLIAGLNSGSAFPVGVTTQKFVVTDGAGATDTCSFNVTVSYVTDIGQNNGNHNSLTVMPVPATDNLTVIYKSGSSASLHVKLMNTAGQLVMSEDITPFNGNYRKTIDLKEQAAGTYILEITSDSESITRKIVKM